MQHPFISSVPAHQVEEKHQNNCINTDQDHSFNKDNGVNTNGDDFLCEEVEEEDSNTSFARKFILLNRGNPAYAHTVMLQHLYNGFRDHVPNSNHLSCKYIMQKTLRI